MRKRFAAAAAALLVGIVVAVVLTTSAAPQHARPQPQQPALAPPAPATERFGANTGRLFNDRTYTPAQIGAQLEALRRAGATVARSDALWEASEPAPPVNGVHHYDWRFDDSIAGALAAHELQWLPIVDYSAPWAQSIAGRDHSPPASATAVAGYAEYAAALAGRYGPGGAFWRSHPQLRPEPVDTYEIWNEPDNPLFWSPSPDAAAYAALYLRARGAIDAVQPGARVIVGGLTHPASFVSEMLAASPDLLGRVDGIGIHPYGATPEAVLASVRAARIALDAARLGTVPLYVTEFGWTTHPPGALDGAPGQRRPAYVAETVAALGHTDCGIADALLYAWVTPERDPANAQDWFGIAPPGGGSTPDTLAFADGLRAAASPGRTIALCP